MGYIKLCLLLLVICCAVARKSEFIVLERLVCNLEQKSHEQIDL